MFRSLVVLVVTILALGQVKAFVKAPVGRSGLAPLRENFFLDLPTLTDPGKAAPQLLVSEENYRNVVDGFDDGALLNKVGPFPSGGKAYQPFERVRALKLLTATANSGLLEALEAKGLTLSQVERLLPLADSLGLLGLVKSNKDLVSGAAPLLIEPAAGLLPLLTSVVNGSPSVYKLMGVSLAGLGLVEASDNALLGAPLVLLGLPLIVLGTVLGSIGGSLPAANSYSAGSNNNRNVKAVEVNGLSVKSTVGSSSVKVTNTRQGGTKNGKRKVVRVPMYQK